MDEFRVREERVRGERGVGLRVLRCGPADGPPVVLLHGFPEDARSWRHQTAPLARAGFAVHAADLRGYAGSDRPPERRAYALPELVGDVAALVGATGRDRAHVVGHDWGGVVAWAFSARHPRLLDRLAILNAPHPAAYAREVRRPRQLLKSWYAAFFLLPWLPEKALAAGDFRAVREIFRRSPARPGAFSEAEIDGYVSELRRPGALKAAVDYYRANAAAARSGGRGMTTEAETLVIWGERDSALSPRLLDGLERYVPRLEVLRLPQAGHWVQSEAADEVTAALIEFLGRGERHEGPSAAERSS